jgi:hypothetical protein
MTAPGSTPPPGFASRRPAPFKLDHPRAIDRYIDFFGEGTARDRELRAAFAHGQIVVAEKSSRSLLL